MLRKRGSSFIPSQAPSVDASNGRFNSKGRHRSPTTFSWRCRLTDPDRWKPDVPTLLPKAGVFARTQALVVARNIAAEVNGSAQRVKFMGDGYCALECGRAGFAFGNFFAEPQPSIRMRRAGRSMHLGKVLFEKNWLGRGMKRNALRIVGNFAARLLGMPALLQ